MLHARDPPGGHVEVEGRPEPRQDFVDVRFVERLIDATVYPDEIRGPGVRDCSGGCMVFGG